MGKKPHYFPTFWGKKEHWSRPTPTIRRLSLLFGRPRQISIGHWGGNRNATASLTNRSRTFFSKLQQGKATRTRDPNRAGRRRGTDPTGRAGAVLRKHRTVRAGQPGIQIRWDRRGDSRSARGRWPHAQRAGRR